MGVELWGAGAGGGKRYQWQRTDVMVAPHLGTPSTGPVYSCESCGHTFSAPILSRLRRSKSRCPQCGSFDLQIGLRKGDVILIETNSPDLRWKK